MRCTERCLKPSYWVRTVWKNIKKWGGDKEKQFSHRVVLRKGRKDEWGWAVPSILIRWQCISLVSTTKICKVAGCTALQTSTSWRRESMTERGRGGEGRRFDLCPHELTNEEMMLCLPAVLQIVDKWVFELPLQQSTRTHTYMQTNTYTQSYSEEWEMDRWIDALLKFVSMCSTNGWKFYIYMAVICLLTHNLSLFLFSFYCTQLQKSF